MSDTWFQAKLTTISVGNDNAVSALRIYTTPLQHLFTGTASATATADTLIASDLNHPELLWHLIYATAAELPQHHASLIDLLLALQSRHQAQQPSSPTEQHVPAPAPAPALATWLAHFGPTWRTRRDALWAAREDGFDRPAQFDAHGKQLPREGDMYVNFDAFSARLLGAGFTPEVRGMLREAARTALAGVLEREVEGYDGGIVRRERFGIEMMVLFWLDVWAAVQWVVFAGEEVRGGEGQEEEGGLLEVNGLWKGGKGFSEERWGFWRERLRGFLEVRGTVPDPVRGVVEEAVRCME